MIYLYMIGCVISVRQHIPPSVLTRNTHEDSRNPLLLSGQRSAVSSTNSQAMVSLNSPVKLNLDILENLNRKFLKFKIQNSKIALRYHVAHQRKTCV